MLTLDLIRIKVVALGGADTPQHNITSGQSVRKEAVGVLGGLLVGGLLVYGYKKSLVACDCCNKRINGEIESHKMAAG